MDKAVAREVVGVDTLLGRVYLRLMLFWDLMFHGRRYLDRRRHLVLDLRGAKVGGEVANGAFAGSPP